MNRKLATYLVAVVGLLAVVGQAAPASAVTFAFSQSTGWEFGTATTQLTPGMSPNLGGVEFFEPAVNPNPALLPGDNAPPPNTYTTIGWGCGSSAASSCANNGVNANVVVTTDPPGNPRDNDARSSLYLQGLAGNISDDGVWVNISYAEHKNNPIFGRTLASVEIESILRFETNPGTADAQTIEVGFTETLNNAPCAGPNPQGSTCDDFFAFDFTGGAFDPLVITSDGIEYTVEFRLFNLTNATFDPATGRIFTAEGETSSLNVQARIESRAVPEPATLLLLGAGLMGFGVFATVRRRSL